MVATPRRIYRPRKVLDLPRIMVTDGKVTQADVDHFTRTLLEHSRDTTETPAVDPGYDYSFTSSAGAAAEAVVLTILGFTFVNGRAYEIPFGQLTSTATANAEAIFRVRKATVTGTIWGIGGRVPMPNVASSYSAGGSFFVVREANARNITLDVVLTLQGVGGTVTHVASADQPRYFSIMDVGPAYQFPYAHTVR